MIVFDFCNSGPIQLNTVPGQPPRETVLRYRRSKVISRLRNFLSNDVLYARAVGHMTSLPLEKLLSVLQ
jgi:hypothetical protein